MTQESYTPFNYKLQICDGYNFRIRHLDLKTNEMTTLVGSGTSGLTDGIGAAAQFQNPVDLKISKDMTFAFVSQPNLRRIDMATLEVTTVAGGAYQGSGMLAMDISEDMSFLLICYREPGKMIRKYEIATGVWSNVAAVAPVGANGATSYGIAISADMTFALFTMLSGHEIRHLDLKTGTV